MLHAASARKADLPEARVTDGRGCLLIPTDSDISVNGQPVFAAKFSRT